MVVQWRVRGPCSCDTLPVVDACLCAANEALRSESLKTEQRLRELTAQLAQEKNAAVAEALEREQRRAEAHSAQLAEQANARLVAAEARAKSELQVP